MKSHELLNYSGGEHYFDVRNRNKGGSILMTNVQCTGNEENFKECNYDYEPCCCNHFKDAAVLCYDGKFKEGNYRPSSVNLISLVH